MRKKLTRSLCYMLVFCMMLTMIPAFPLTASATGAAAPGGQTATQTSLIMPLSATTVDVSGAYLVDHVYDNLKMVQKRKEL